MVAVCPPPSEPRQRKTFPMVNRRWGRSMSTVNFNYLVWVEVIAREMKERSESDRE